MIVTLFFIAVVLHVILGIAQEITYGLRLTFLKRCLKRAFFWPHLKTSAVVGQAVSICWVEHV